GALLAGGGGPRGGHGGGVPTLGVDEISGPARAAGALGGKLLGAGGGGFLLLFARPDRHEGIKQRLGRLIHVPFHFESGGSQIIFFDPETEYHDEERARASSPRPVFRERRGPGPAS